MLSLTDILQAKNGFKQENDGNSQDTVNNMLGGVQSGIKISDLLKNAGILGGSQAGAVSAVPPVPPVV